MLENFEQMDADLLTAFGVEVEHRFVGGYTAVTVIRMDPANLNDVPAGAFMVLMGSVEYSGFEQLPVKGDTFVLDEKNFRVFEVKREDQTDGLWIFLEQQR